MTHHEGKRDPNILEVAEMAIKPIKELAESESPSDKLLALNMILVLIVVSLSTVYFFNTPLTDIAGLMMLALSFIFGAIISGVYIYFTKLLNKSYKIKSLRYSISLLLIAIPFSAIGMAVRNQYLINWALGLIIVQFLVLVVTSLFIKNDIETSKETDIWGLLGKAEVVLGIISSIASLLGITLL